MRIRLRPGIRGPDTAGRTLRRAARGAAGRATAMSLPAGQQRVLQRIEQTLVTEDPELGSLFAVFTRLTGQDAMPHAEQLMTAPRRPRRVRAATVIVLALTALLSMILVTALTRGSQACGGAPAAGRSQPAAAQPASCRPGRSPQP